MQGWPLRKLPGELNKDRPEIITEEHDNGLILLRETLFCSSSSIVQVGQVEP